MKYLTLVTLLLSSYTYAVTVTFTGVVGGLPKFGTPTHFKVEGSKVSWTNSSGEELSSKHSGSNHIFYLAIDDDTNKKIVTFSI
ncbi:TPA: hypothetical protein P0E24_000203 [Vibrio campbellii]|uniref:hypothetical protein n=1 Tax=Vibrio sp. M260121 TaxID=3020897 RepID=UPI002F3EF07D|nr:hypothetical protein [Vibrio campbellii]HDM8241176.1 hypothetical protein [Vibrio campbellii]